MLPNDPVLLSITRSVNDLAVTSRALTTGLERSIWRVRLVVGVLGLLAAVLAYQVVELTRLGRIADTNQERIAALQLKTSNEVLCPLYGLFLRSYNPAGPAATYDPVGYEEGFITIEAGAKALACPVQERVRR